MTLGLVAIVMIVMWGNNQQGPYIRVIWNLELVMVQDVVISIVYDLKG